MHVSTHEHAIWFRAAADIFENDGCDALGPWIVFCQGALAGARVARALARLLEINAAQEQ
jgi:hypothetical protein